MSCTTAGPSRVWHDPATEPTLFAKTEVTGHEEILQSLRERASGGGGGGGGSAANHTSSINSNSRKKSGNRSNNGNSAVAKGGDRKRVAIEADGSGGSATADGDDAGRGGASRESK